MGTMRYIRSPEYDKRIANGDDYAGDAWIDTLTGNVVWSVVGYDRNQGQWTSSSPVISISEYDKFAETPDNS